MPIIECIPNISEGRHPDVVAAIAAAVGRTPGVRVLDVSSDAAHHRSVLTMAGDAAGLKAAMLALFEEALAVDRSRGARRRASAARRRRRRAVRPDRRRDDGGLRRAGARTRRSVAERFGVPVYPLRGGGDQSGAAQSRRHPPRRVRGAGGEDAQPGLGAGLRSRRAPPTRRRHGHRRTDAAHRLQHQPCDRPPRRGQEDRRGGPAEQRRISLREGDGRRARGSRHRRRCR